MADQSYQLVVRKGPRPGQVFPLTLDTITIGRDPLSDIVINDPEVSRHHAKIHRTAEGYELQDMGSTNGSFVDGKRMGGDPVDLRPGQVVMLGSNVTLIYQATSASDPMATMIAPTGMPGIEEPVGAVEPEPEAEPEIDAEPVPEIVTSPEMKIEEAMPEAGPRPDPAPAPEPDFAEPEMPAPEPEPEAEFVSDQDEGLATMMEPSAPYESPEPTPMPSFEEPEPMPAYKEPEPLPSYDSGAPLPDFDSEPAAAAPPPPGSGMGTAEKQGGGRNRNLMIAIIVIILLCCCCLIIVGAVYGQDILNQLQLLGLDSTVPLGQTPTNF